MRLDFQILLKSPPLGLLAGSAPGCRFAINASFYKMIKVDLSPTRVDSSARTFILLALSMILVKSFFHLWRHTTYCINCKQLYCVRHAPCLWNYLPEEQLNFQSLWKVCYFLPYNTLCCSGNSSSGFKERLFTCAFKFGNTWMHKVSKRSFNPLLEFSECLSLLFQEYW